MDASQGAPLRLTLVRHGETEWSLSGRHTGVTDVALTARGEDGARALAPPLGRTAFTRVLVSPRARAQRTCALAGLGAGAAIEPDLAEWNYGDYEGLRSAEICRDRPDWSIFRDGCPNGELPAAVAARADRLLARLRGEGGAVALFSHGHFGRVLAMRWIGAPVAMAAHFSLGVASLSRFGADPSHPETPAIVLWNYAPASLD